MVIVLQFLRVQAPLSSWDVRLSQEAAAKIRRPDRGISSLSSWNRAEAENKELSTRLISVPWDHSHRPLGAHKNRSLPLRPKLLDKKAGASIPERLECDSVCYLCNVLEVVGCQELSFWFCNPVRPWNASTLASRARDTKNVLWSAARETGMLHLKKKKNHRGPDVQISPLGDNGSVELDKGWAKELYLPTLVMQNDSVRWLPPMPPCQERISTGFWPFGGCS